MVRSIRVIGEFINGDDDVVFWGRRSYIVLAQTIFMSISFIDILRITLSCKHIRYYLIEQRPSNQRLFLSLQFDINWIHKKSDQTISIHIVRECTAIYSFWRIADLFDSDWSWRLENQKPNFELWLFDSWQPKSPPPLKHSRRDQV